MNIYEHKYLKYKEKYILLKQSIGGGEKETSIIKEFIKSKGGKFFSDYVMILKDNKKVDNYNIYFYIYDGSNPPLFYKSVNNIIPSKIISMAKSQCYITHDSKLYISCDPPITSKPFNNITQIKDVEAINIYNEENRNNLVSNAYSLEDYKNIIIEWKKDRNINTPNWWESK
jgi:hypothetical protein